MGTRSMTSNRSRLPKLRVTIRSCTPGRPQATHNSLAEIDRDDVERSGWADLDDGFRTFAPERDATDDCFCFAGVVVFLALDD